MDSSGVVQWARQYNDSLNYGDQCVAIVVDNAGDIIVTGESFGWGPGYPVSEIATIKYDASGNELWIRRHESSTSTALPADIAVDDDNNVYVSGSAYDANTKFDCITIKYDANGNLQWLQLVNGVLSNADGGSAMLYDNGKLYVAGYVENATSYYDALLVGYNESGSILLREEWNSSGDEEDYFHFLKKDNSGNLIAAGIVEKTNDDDLMVVKYSTLGVGISELKQQEFFISPNPASGEVNIHGSVLQAGEELMILDVMGKQIYYERLSSATSSLKLHASNFESGLYFVRVESGGNIFTRKLIVQK
jgi:hypothetical protein